VIDRPLGLALLRLTERRDVRVVPRES